MNERYENDYENTANQWEETEEGGRVTYRESAPRYEAESGRQTGRRTVQYDDELPEEQPQAYVPTGTREYRADSRPGRPRASRTSGIGGGGGGAAVASTSLVQPIMLAAVALLVLISIITGIVSCATSGGGEAGEAAVETAAATTQAQMNVDAAEKTTDENGIVHGTTADGTNFTIVQADQPAAAATSESTDASTAEGEQGDAAAASQGGKVSFAAVGDQIASEYLLPVADANAGETDDGKYDFKPFYKEVKPFLQQSNLRYINQETPLNGGQDGIEVAGYPNFISPEACAEAIADTGFNLVNFDTNHSYDGGTEGIEYSQKVWAKYPQIVIGGSYASKEDRETVHMIESNGIRFAFLAYSYGDNSYEDVSKEPNNYYAVPFVKEDAAADIERAKQVADCIIVSMHWGDEYTAELNANQKDWAQWLADEDVDLVIGTHAHNIQPVEYYTGKNGNKIPIVFGLGDFVSGWTMTDTILSGLFTCDFVRQDSGRVSVENPKWHPLIEWSDGNEHYVRMLENMTVDEINANTMTEEYPNSSFQHVYEYTNSVITQIPVEWGADAEDKAAKAAAGDSEGSSSSSAEDASESSSTSSDEGSDDGSDEGTDTDADSADGDAASGYVDEDGDGYDDNTDEWIGGDDEGSDADSAGGYVDEDGDGYDDNTDEWIGGDDDSASYDESGDEDYSSDEEGDEYYEEE